MGFDPKVVSRTTLLRTHVFDVERIELEHEGIAFEREIARHRGAVAVLAVEDRDVVLVRQWRAPLGRTILEVPAGTRDVDGEDPVDTARRELAEETGVLAAHLEVLLELWNAPGWSDQLTIVYLASGLSEVPARPSGPEEAAIEVVRLSLGDALSLVPRGECDATTAAALLALAARERAR